jgi:hypothetical protein
LNKLIVGFKKNVEDSIKPKGIITYDVVYKNFMRELKMYFNQDMNQIFKNELRKCNVRNMKFPFILIKPSSFLSAKDLTNK